MIKEMIKNNIGYVKRLEMAKESRLIEMIVDLDLSIFAQAKYLFPGISLQFRMNCL